jgi:hypothetical protein
MARDMNPRLEEQDWVVLIDRVNQSRMSTREVKAYVQAGKLARETMVWRDGMSAWASIGSIAELATHTSRPTVPRGQLPAKYNPRLAETVASSYRAAQHNERRPAAPGPKLMLELVATAAAVLLTVLATSYALYAAGAYQAGNARPDADAHAGAPAAD